MADRKAARLLETQAQQLLISHFYRVPPLKAGHETSPDSSGGEMDTTSCEKERQKSHCNGTLM